MASIKRSPPAADDSMNVFYPAPDAIELVRFNKSLFRDLATATPGSKLESLPAELVTRICKYLPLTARINLAMSSKHLADTFRANGIVRFDPGALTPSDIQLLRQVMPFKAYAVLLCKSQTEPMDVWCSHCWITRYAALEICHESWWVGTGTAFDLRYHMKMELKRRRLVAVVNIKEIMHLIRAFLCWEKAEYMRKQNRPAAFLSLKYRKAVDTARE